LPPSDKPLRWVGNALEELRAFPDDPRRRAGRQLRRLQQGLAPDDWRTMASVGPGVAEIRIHYGAEYRVIYLAKFVDAIYVLHAFEKRSGRTRRLKLEIARKRLKTVLQSRDSR